MLDKVKSLADNILHNNTEILFRLNGGMMNSSFVILSVDKKYVLYIPEGDANKLVNRLLEKENQKIVSDLKITSKNIYFDIESGIKMNEYIEGESLNKVDEYNLDKIAALFKKLHSSKIMSKEDYNPFVRFERYEANRKLVHNIDEHKYTLTKNILYKYKYYLESFPKTLCHNDGQKSNIIKTPNDEYMLIDFEFMANNDPIYDIATFGNDKVIDGFNLLNKYCEVTPDIKKRFYLWRIFISLQWYNVAILKHYNGEGKSHGYNFLSVASHFLDNAFECVSHID